MKEKPFQYTIDQAHLNFGLPNKTKILDDRVNKREAKKKLFIKQLSESLKLSSTTKIIFQQKK